METFKAMPDDRNIFHDASHLCDIFSVVYIHLFSSLLMSIDFIMTLSITILQFLFLTSRVHVTKEEGVTHSRY